MLYKLSVDSEPQGMPFVIDVIPETFYTPLSKYLGEGEHLIKFAKDDGIPVGGVRYYWDHWDNGEWCPVRMVSLPPDTQVKGYYRAEPPPPQKPPPCLLVTVLNPRSRYLPALRAFRDEMLVGKLGVFGLRLCMCYYGFSRWLLKVVKAHAL